MSTRSLERHALEQAVAIDLAQFLQEFKGGMSDVVSALRGMAINDVLDDEVAVIPATGVWSRDFSVPFAAIALYTGTAVVTVAADSPQMAAPAPGPGSQVITGGAVVNMCGRTISIYGAAGSQISLQVFTKPQPPSYSPAAQITTAASAQGMTRFLETNVAQLANVTLNGAAHDNLAGTFARFRAFAAADVAGTLAIDQSRDGITWFNSLTAGIPANFAQCAILESIITLRFVRGRVINGAAPQGSFEFDTTLVAI